MASKSSATVSLALSRCASFLPRHAAPSLLTRNNFIFVAVAGSQLFLGRPNRVYIVDKTENNPTQIKGHPAWAAGMHTSSAIPFYLGP